MRVYRFRVLFGDSNLVFFDEDAPEWNEEVEENENPYGTYLSCEDIETISFRDRETAIRYLENYLAEQVIVEDQPEFEEWDTVRVKPALVGSNLWTVKLSTGHFEAIKLENDRIRIV